MHSWGRVLDRRRADRSHSLVGLGRQVHKAGIVTQLKNRCREAVIFCYVSGPIVGSEDPAGSEAWKDTSVVGQRGEGARVAGRARRSEQGPKAK